MGGPRVDFYVLASRDSEARLRFACRLVEKAWRERHRVRVQLEPGGQLAAFDELLWTFGDRSFVPHGRAGGEEPPPAGAPPPVVLADDDCADGGDGDTLVNLAAAVPPRFGQFARIAEVVDAESERRRLARERYRFYRGQGIEPETHEMGDPS